MKTVCPRCGTEYDLDDSMNGKKVECECGGKWVVTFSPAPSSAAAPVRRRKRKKKYDPTLINALNLKERENYTPVPMMEKQELPVFIEDFDKDSEQHADENIRCPECGSTQITANKKGINVANAVIGSVLFGGIGILAGLVGKDKIIITCLNCGHHWQPGEKTVKPE
ncbi:MAG: hypothetical protein ACI406_17460 [Victivallis vadensis]